MEISIYSIFNWISATVVFTTAIMILYLSKKSISARLFSTIGVLYSIWSILIALGVSTSDVSTHEFITKSCHFLGTLIAALFVIISLYYTRLNNRISNIITIILVIIEFVFLYSIYSTKLIIASSVLCKPILYLCWSYGSAIIIYDMYFVLCWIIGIGILLNKWQKETDTIQKNNLGRIIIAFIIGIIPPTITTILLPQIGIFSLYWLSPLSGVAWIIIIAYSISKYNLFDIKVLAIQVATFALWIFILIRIFLTNSSQEMIIECGIFVISIIIGTIIIRYAIFENRQKESIEQLASNLQSLNSTLSFKVAEQTAEIRKAYELEKHARRDLEKLNETKDQFIMITQHHLRAPVTRIKNDLSSTISGENGKISMGLAKALRETNNAAYRLGKIVDDFLDITTLKVGSQILNIETGNLKPLVEDVLGELKIDIEKMHLKVVYPHDTASWPDLQIDASKMREVLLIILENAVKYKVDGRTIEIKNRLVDGADNVAGSSHHIFEMTIENSGMGLVVEDKEKLFSRHFYRSQRAQKANPIGMGIGLSVARAVVRAHHGTLEIESDGEGMGARVMIRLPNF